MPFEHEIDSNTTLVTIRVSGCAATADALAKARELVRDRTLDGRYRLLILVDGVDKDSTADELREFAELLRLMGRKFKGRKAIVATETGRLTTARVIALMASTNGDVEAFTAEDAARAWLFDET